MMLALVLYFLAAAGLSFIVGFSKISLPFRRLLGGEIAVELLNASVTGAPDDHVVNLRVERVKAGKDANWDIKPLVPVVGPFLVALIECPGCLGWWIGVAAGALCPSFVHLAAPGVDELVLSRFGVAVLLGLATAGSNMLLGKKMGLVE